MKIIITLPRVLSGILVGFAGCIALLNAPYQLLNVNFRFTTGGPFILLSLILGTLLLWGLATDSWPSCWLADSR